MELSGRCVAVTRQYSLHPGFRLLPSAPHFTCRDVVRSVFLRLFLTQRLFMRDFAFDLADIETATLIPNILNSSHFYFPLPPPPLPVSLVTSLAPACAGKKKFTRRARTARRKKNNTCSVPRSDINSELLYTRSVPIPRGLGKLYGTVTLK